MYLMNAAAAAAAAGGAHHALLRHQQQQQQLRQKLDARDGEQCTGVKIFIGSKVLCVFCFKICTPEGRGEKREGMQISK